MASNKPANSSLPENETLEPQGRSLAKKDHLFGVLLTKSSSQNEETNRNVSSVVPLPAPFMKGFNKHHFFGLPKQRRKPAVKRPRIRLNDLQRVRLETHFARDPNWSNEEI